MKIISVLSRVLNALPIWLIESVQSLLSFTAAHIIHYRRRIIIQNLDYLFPKLSSMEKNSILQNFYKFLAGMVLQTFLNIYPNPKSKKKVTLLNPEFLQPYNDNPQSVIVVLSHYSNWELITTYGDQLPQQCISVYK